MTLLALNKITPSSLCQTNADRATTSQQPTPTLWLNASALKQPTPRRIHLPALFGILLLHIAIMSSLFWATPEIIQPPVLLPINVTFVAQDNAENAEAAPSQATPQETILSTPTHSKLKTPTPTIQNSPKAPPYFETLEPTNAGSMVSNTTTRNASAESVTTQPTTQASNAVALSATHSQKFEPARSDLAYLNNPKPPYPSLSQKLGEQGTVTLRVLVDTQGRPSKVSIAHSSGFDRLDRAAVKAVQDWKFQPAKRGEQPVEDTALVPITFTLD